MEKEIEVTVLMSMYNTPLEQLSKSVESILRQTYKDFEFIIINDGANEECVNLVQSYRDNRINLVSNEKNLGLEKSLNKGLKIARGQYIIRMDTDDIAYPTRIEKQLEFAKQHTKYSIIGSRAKYFDENGVFGQSQKVGEIKREDFLFGTPFMHPTLIMRRDDIIKIGGYPLYKRCEDYAMEMELYSQGYKGYIMEDTLMKYRMDNSGYKKKTFKFRLIEIKLKMHYFKKLDIKLYKYIYILKPLLAGIVPKSILKKYHKRKLSRGIKC